MFILTALPSCCIAAAVMCYSCGGSILGVSRQSCDLFSLAKVDAIWLSLFAGLVPEEVFTTNPDETNIHLAQWGWLV
jgi:hypothetical protein